MEIGKTFCGHTYVWTDGHTDRPQFQSTRSSLGDDLIKCDDLIKLDKEG